MLLDTRPSWQRQRIDNLDGWFRNVSITTIAQALSLSFLTPSAIHIRERIPIPNLYRFSQVEPWYTSLMQLVGTSSRLTEDISLDTEMIMHCLVTKIT